MDLIIRAHGNKLSERQRNLIAEKLARLDRYVDGETRATVELTEQPNHHDAPHRVQVTLQGQRGMLVRAERRGSEMQSTLDEVADTLQRQIKRYKEKHWHGTHLRRPAPAPLDAPQISEIDATQGPQIVRSKAFNLKPMSDAEALEQMELLEHDFFIYRDADTLNVQVLYRRRNGNYGLIVADAAEKP